MNYNELVYFGDKAVMQIVNTPIGVFHRRQAGGRPANFVDLRDCMVADGLLSTCLAEECRVNSTISDRHQIHFELHAAPGERPALHVEQGCFVSVANLLRDNPASMSRSEFLDKVVSDILASASALHSQGIYHLCFSPDNVFVRKGDGNVMLLSHGSFYLSAPQSRALYSGFEAYVAPEVTDGGSVDARSDVYSIGRFLEYLFTFTSTPYRHGRVLRKAVSRVPEDRYGSVDELAAAIRRAKREKTAAAGCCVALLAAGIAAGGYFAMASGGGAGAGACADSTSSVGFVAPPQPADTVLGDMSEMSDSEAMLYGDTASAMSADERRQLKEYEDKCEQIFRKRYAKEADRILSKIYNDANMGSNEKKFMAASQATLDELVKAQESLAAQSNISRVRSQRIATEVIDEITEKKKKALTNYGVQK